jgi:hypothetical protein
MKTAKVLYWWRRLRNGLNNLAYGYYLRPALGRLQLPTRLELDPYIHVYTYCEIPTLNFTKIF